MATKKYKHLSHHDQILHRPDTYLGSMSPNDVEESIFVDGKIVQAKVSLANGARRCFLEILSNAGDQADFSRRDGVDPGSIDLTIEKNRWVTITNYGSPIPVQPDEDPRLSKLIPGNVFSQLLYGSNYDDCVLRTGCGRNGYGSKLTNIFSIAFEVEVGDNIRGHLYKCKWTDNMKVVESETCTPGYTRSDKVVQVPAVVEKGKVIDPAHDETHYFWKENRGKKYTGENYVLVRWHLDFPRFGAKEYSANDIGLLSRYLIDFSMTCKVPVTLNGKPFDFSSIRSYASLLYGKKLVANNSFVHFEFPKTIKGDPEKTASNPKSVDDIPDVELIVIDSTESKIYAFVNGLATNYGSHVDEVLTRFITPMIEAVNEKVLGRRKGFARDEPHLTPGDAKSKISFILNCRIPNPVYTSQDKQVLDKKSKIKVKINGADFEKSFLKWNLCKQLIDDLANKRMKVLSKSDGSKVENVEVHDLADANKAGTKESQKCTLYIVEGKSASSYPKKRIDFLPSGRDYSGYYPLFGKFMNFTAADPDDIAAYVQYANIKAALGLKEGVDYTQDVHFKELRYGFVCINTDADSDGSHIATLLVNMFHVRFPALLRRGMIGYLLTPVVRVFKGTKVIERFYDEKSFEEWRSTSGTKGTRVEYYKGLGTSMDAEIKDDIKMAPVVILKYDEDAASSLERTFHPRKADERKLWISEQREIHKSPLDCMIPLKTKGIAGADINMTQNVSFIINNGLIPYTIDSMFRALMSQKDGLKKSQRQALYFMLTHWNYGNSSKPIMKVEDVGSAAKVLTKYHHGAKSMIETIVHMAQTYTGSNNLSVAYQGGQFGTRDDSDAAEARYIGTALASWVPYAFSKEMVELVPKRLVEGHEVEPVWIPCDVPLGVINGGQGMATGWSTTIPSHHPLAVIDWLIAKIDGKPTEPLVPWFNGYTGGCFILHKRIEDLDDEGLPDEPPVDRSTGRHLLLTGIMEITEEYEDGTVDIEITEIPVGRWVKAYHAFLNTFIKKKQIKKVHNHSSSATGKIHFVLERCSKEIADIKSLKLYRSIGLSNLVLIDDRGYPSPFRYVEDIVEIHYNNMSDMYSKLKDSKLSVLEKRLFDVSEDLRLVETIKSENIKYADIPDAKMMEWLEENNFDESRYDKLHVRDFAPERIRNLKTTISNLQADVNSLKATPFLQLWKNRLIILRDRLSKTYDEPEPLPEEVSVRRYSSGKSVVITTK